MRSWSYLYWERLELQGDIHALIRKLQALDDFLGHSPDAADSQWSIVQTFTIRDRTPHNTTMMWHAFYENEGPVERLDVLLAQVIVRAPNIHTLVVELGGYSVESGPWRTATAICGLRALRVLSLAHFHSIAFLENAPFVPFHNVPRKLTDVVLQDCYGLDLHGLLENQSALRTVDLDTIGIASNIVESWNNVGSISIYLEDFIDDWIPVNDDDWIQAICRPLLNGGLPNLRALSLAKPMLMNQETFDTLLPALALVPLESLRLMLQNIANNPFDGFGPHVLEDIFTRLPHLTSFCLDHAAPFLHSRDNPTVSYAWPGEWDSYLVAFAKATRLQTFVSTVVSVRVNEPDAYSHHDRCLHTGWGFGIGPAVRAHTRSLFDMCSALQTVLWLAPRGMLDYAETRTHGRANFTAHKGHTLMPDARFWVPPLARDVETGRHQWNVQSGPRIRAGQIFARDPRKGPNQRDKLLDTIWDPDCGQKPAPKPRSPKKKRKAAT